MGRDAWIEAANQVKENPSALERALIARNFARLFGVFNPRFNEEKFLASCGVEVE